MKRTSLKMLAVVFLMGFTLGAQVPNRFERNVGEKPNQDESANKPNGNQEAKPETNEQKPSISPPPPPPPKPRFVDKLSFGGSMGLSFGTITFVQLNPRIGYELSKNTLAGIGFTYIYLNDKRFNPAFEQSIFGFSPFVNHRVFDLITLGAEYELLQADVISRIVNYSPEYSRDWVHAFYLGAGYVPENRGPFVFLLWNVLYDPLRSVYPNPVIRIGFMF